MCMYKDGHCAHFTMESPVVMSALEVFQCCNVSDIWNTITLQTDIINHLFLIKDSYYV